MCALCVLFECECVSIVCVWTAQCTLHVVANGVDNPFTFSMTSMMPTITSAMMMLTATANATNDDGIGSGLDSIELNVTAMLSFSTLGTILRHKVLFSDTR